MKIIHVLNHFLPDQTAGTEVYAWALAKALLQKNTEVEIVIPNYKQDFSRQYVYDGLNVFKYAETSVTDRALIMGLREPDGLKIFSEYVANAKPDIIHFHELAGSNGITLKHVIVAKKSGAKIVMTFHLAGYTCKTGTLLYNETELCDGKIRINKCSSCYLNSKGHHFLKPVLISSSILLQQLHINPTHWNYRVGTALGTTWIIDQLKQNFETLINHCDAVVPIAHWYKDILRLNGVPEKKIRLIKQALPLEAKQKPAVISENNDGNSIRLIFIGRIHPLKGLHILIEALMELPEDKIELYIYGQAGDDEYSKHWTGKTQHKKNIHWKGVLPNNEVVETMQQFDALCLCSTFSEMSPLVIQEAFAARIPVIASNVYGNAEQIEHNKNGLLFQFKNTASLHEQLLRCINEPNLLYSFKKNSTPPRLFNDVAEEYYELYKTLLN